jgi:hypothetical protein
LNPGQVEGKQNPATQVAHGIPRGGDPVDLVGTGDMGEQCLVKHDASSHSDERDGKQRGREVQITPLYEEHARNRRNSNQHE